MKISFLKKQKVFVSIVFFLGVITIFASYAPNELNSILLKIKNFIFDYFAWSYVLFTSFFLFMLLYLVFSKYGTIVLGDSTSKPEFSFLTWLSMLFSAGMGIGLMYFGVAEPIMHFSSPISNGKAENALLHTLFHWALHPWAIYGVLALIISFFSYKQNLPLSLKSILFPIFKNRINGALGVFVDIITILAIVFGLITTFALGSSQLNSGLLYLGILDSANLSTQFSIILTVSIIACISSFTGINSGVRKLSNLNFFLALFLLAVFIYFSGKIVFLFLLENFGYYLNNLFKLSFSTFAYDGQHAEWFKSWTLFYWAWWVSWAPFVALFIARISKGRTIREFILGVLIAPSLLALLWFTVFGNTAISIDVMNNGVLSAFSKSPDILLFKFFEFFPLSTPITVVSMMIIFLFFITSIDSGILVLNHLTFGQSDRVSYIQSLFWVSVFVFLTTVLLMTGGINAIQNLVIIIALPLLFFMFFSCLLFLFTLIKNEFKRE